MEVTKINVKLDRIIFSKESFIIASDSNNLIYTGYILEDSKKLLNIDIELMGCYVNHEKYGKQFKFTSYKIKVNYNFFFLTNMVKGITENIANEILTKCGNNFEQILETNPDLLLTIKGIGKKKLETIRESFFKNRHLKELSDFLLPYEISTNAIIKIHDYFKENSVAKIKENPYLLTKIRGVSFKKADDIALKIGLKSDSLFRIDAGIFFSLNEQIQQHGHTIIKKSNLFEIACENLDNDFFVLTSELFLASIKRATQREDLIYPDVSEQYVTTRELYEMEKFIYDTLKANHKIKKGTIVSDIISFIAGQESKRGFKFGEKQKNIIELANEEYNILYLAGYAGSGKTTISKTIMDIYAGKYGEQNVVACALSGIAANRAKIVTGYKGVTIHNLLGFKGGVWEYSEENTLPYSLIMLDEASMTDTRIFYTLLKAIDFSKTTLYIAGDPGQLQSVGPGEVFKNIILKKLVYGVELDKVFRQSEDQVINIFATQHIRVGSMPGNYNNKHEDFEFIQADIDNYWNLKNKLSKEQLREVREENNNKIILSMIDVCRKHYNFIYKWRENIWEYITDFQVIAPMKNGTLGVDNLNKTLQSLFNGNAIGDEISIEDRKYRFRDKIVHLRNRTMKTVNYDSFKQNYKDIKKLVADNNLVIERRVYNGQLGVIINVNKEADITSVYYPNEGYVVFYSENDFKTKDILHSYALTIHKTQGSEFANIFVPLTLSHFNMLNNQLMYTAITRGKNKVYMSGETAAFKRACTNVFSAKRHTVLEYLN